MGRFTAISLKSRAVGLAGALACAVALGGCGGVEFEGKVFDYMGISGDRQQGDVHMSERPPLMVPPNLRALPQPGTGPEVATARQDWPDNPEVVRQRTQQTKDKAEAEREAKADPLNAYAGKETLLDKLLGREKTEEAPIADVPEPDASDRLPSETATNTPHKPLAPHVPEAPLPDRNDGDFRPAAPDTYNGVNNPSQSGVF